MYRRKTDDKLLEELLKQGYGSEERRRWRERWRRNLETKHGSERRGPGRFSGTTGSGQSQAGSAKWAQAPHRRAEDAVKPISGRLRRRIDAYAYYHRYRITGLFERILSSLSRFFPRIRDNAGRSLLRMLVQGRGFSDVDPSGFCCADNLDALYYDSRCLLGRYRPGGEEAQQELLQQLRGRDPFAVEFLSVFAKRDEELLDALDYLKVVMASGRKVEIKALTRLVKHVYKHTFLLEGLEPERLDDMYLEVLTVHRTRQASPEQIRQVEVAASRFQIALANLDEFLHSLFPALLKLMGAFFPEEDMWEKKNRQMICDFVGVIEEEKLIYRQIRLDAGRRSAQDGTRESALCAPEEYSEAETPAASPGEAEALESAGEKAPRSGEQHVASCSESAEKKGGGASAEEPDAVADKPSEQPAGVIAEEPFGEPLGRQSGETSGGPFNEEFQGVLSLLERLFPGSNIQNLADFPYLLPYFDLGVFARDLSFPDQIRYVSRFDPMGQIMILHRIIDNLLSSFDGYTIDDALGSGGSFRDSLADISAEWGRIYPNLFDTYLKELGDYVRSLLPGEGRALAAGPASRRLEENLIQLQNLAMRHYDVILVGQAGKPRFSSVRLYKLAEELDDLCEQIHEKINQGLVARGDAGALRLLDEFADRPVVNLHAGSAKPTIRRIVAYIKAKHRKQPSAIPRKSQLIFLEILAGVVKLFSFLLNERGSPYRGCEGRIRCAKEQENNAWKRARAAARGSADGEPATQDYTIDGPTGFWSHAYWTEDFARDFSDIREQGREFALICVDVDGWGRIKGSMPEELIGDRLIRITADTVRWGVERSQGSESFAFRMREDSMLLLVDEGVHAACALGEKMRRRHEQTVQDLHLYADLCRLLEDGEACGTLSVGIAGIGAEDALADACSRAQAAAEEARRAGNRTVCSRDNTLVPYP